MSFDYAEIFKQALPETIVVITAFLTLLVDMVVLRGRPLQHRVGVAALLTSAGCAATILWILTVQQTGTVLAGMFIVDPLTQLMKIAVLGLAIFTALISVQSNFTRHTGEYFALLSLATVGMLFLVSSENLLLIFISLELTSLSLYVMTAFNKQSLESAEAGLKYFLFGGVSAAFTLFGLSLVYGLTHEINLSAIAEKLQGQTLEPVFFVALVMVLIGFGFKIAAVPFHLWAPDAYQGAPTPVASFIASGSKVASFFVLAKVTMLGFRGSEGSAAWGDYVEGWVPLVAVLAVSSMVLGNVAAISQSSVKRLLAYSAIAHAGYALVGMLANTELAVGSLLYYVITYALTTLGAFGVVAVVENEGRGDKLSHFAGLSRRAPLLSICMMIFMLSLAGIPPLAGFFGKFYIFTAAIGSEATNLGLLWLVILAIGMSAVSLYYYLQVLKQIYVADAPAEMPVMRVRLPARVAIVSLALGVVILGCAPGLLVGKLLAAIKIAF